LSVPEGDCVNAFEWLVEKKNFGAVDYGGGQGQFFLHAVRVVGDELFGLVGELHEIEKLGSSFRGDFAVESVHAADKIQIFGSGEATEESHAFGNDADLALHFDRVRGEIEAENFDASSGGSEEAGEHFDGGGFASAVGSEEAEELAGCDAEIYVFYGRERAKAASETIGRDCGGVHFGFLTLA